MMTSKTRNLKEKSYTLLIQNKIIQRSKNDKIILLNLLTCLTHR